MQKNVEKLASKKGTSVASLEKAVKESLAALRAHREAFEERISYIKSFAASESSNSLTDYLAADYLARQGHFATAAKFSAQSHADVARFRALRAITTAIIERKDLSLALEWCHRYRSKLRKMDSSLELKLRLRQFLELVRKGETGAAVNQARKHVAPFAQKRHLGSIQRAMACLLLFSNDALEGKTAVDIYPELFSTSVWDKLARFFTKEFYRLFAIPDAPSLLLLSSAGVAALKTRQCGNAASIDCPACSPHIAKLGERLFYVPRKHTRIICRISGELIDGDIMVLPNGNAFSKAALEKQLASDGKVTCPVSGDRYVWDACVKCYVA